MGKADETEVRESFVKLHVTLEERAFQESSINAQVTQP